MTYLEFIDKKNKKNTSLQKFNESFSEKDVDKSLELIASLFKKHINGTVVFDRIPYDIVVDGNEVKSYMFMQAKDGKCEVAWTLNYLIAGEHADVYSIDFYDATKLNQLLMAGEAKTDLSLYTMGSSVVYFLPIIYEIVNKKNFNITQGNARALSHQIFKDNLATAYKYYVGKYAYTIIDKLNSDIINNTFNETVKSDNPEINKFKQDKLAEIKDADKAGDKDAVKKLWKEYDQIKNAIKNGVTDLAELKLAIKQNVPAVIKLDKETEKTNDEIQMDDPEEAFKKMNKYVKLVLNGMQPSVILCGAPGVGKTYSIGQQLKAAGYHEGHNLFTIKGKCTPRRLYLALYEYQDKGDIIVIDDADALVGPHAPEDCINILKAALDSTADEQGRLVAYGITGKILDDDGDEVPKRFYYRGGVIVITNYQAGSLDSALRGRSFIQDIHFGTQQILDRIKQLMPKLGLEFGLDMACKEKAYEYLQELLDEKAPMVLSMRGFVLCAKMFFSAAKDPEWDDDLAKSMIKEQMRLQAQQEKSKY